MSATKKVTVWQRPAGDGSYGWEWVAACVECDGDCPVLDQEMPRIALGKMSRDEAIAVAAEQFGVRGREVIVDEFRTASLYTPPSAAGRIPVERSAEATAGVPDGIRLAAPAHWGAEAERAARAAAWDISYAMTQTGDCIWDAEPYAHMPESLALPPADVLAAHAPEWWDAAGATHQRQGSPGAWYVRPRIAATV